MELCCKTRITCEVSTSNPSRDDGDADFCSHFKTSLTVLNKLKKGFSNTATKTDKLLVHLRNIDQFYMVNNADA